MTNNQKGVTLIELLVAVVLVSLVMIAGTSLFIQASKNYDRIKEDIILRDEADLLMSRLVKEIYTLPQSHVIEEPTNTDTWLYVKAKFTNLTVSQQTGSACTSTEEWCNTKIGFITSENETSLIINGEIITVSNSNLTIHSDSTITKSSIEAAKAPTYVVSLGLYNTSKGEEKVIWFENEINTINDK